MFFYQSMMQRDDRVTEAVKYSEMVEHPEKSDELNTLLTNGYRVVGKECENASTRCRGAIGDQCPCRKSSA